MCVLEQLSWAIMPTNVWAAGLVFFLHCNTHDRFAQLCCTRSLCIHNIYLLYIWIARLIWWSRAKWLVSSILMRFRCIQYKKKEQRFYILKRCLQKKEHSRRKIFIIISVLVFIFWLTRERKSWGEKCSIRWCSELRSVFFCISLHIHFFLFALTCTSYKIIRSLF